MSFTKRKIKFNPEEPLKDLQIKLQNEMHGIQRIPAIMFNNPTSSLMKLNLTNYEILCFKPHKDFIS